MSCHELIVDKSKMSTLYTWMLWALLKPLTLRINIKNNTVLSEWRPCFAFSAKAMFQPDQTHFCFLGRVRDFWDLVWRNPAFKCHKHWENKAMHELPNWQTKMCIVSFFLIDDNQNVVNNKIGSGGVYKSNRDIFFVSIFFGGGGGGAIYRQHPTKCIRNVVRSDLIKVQFKSYWNELWYLTHHIQLTLSQHKHRPLMAGPSRYLKLNCVNKSTTFIKSTSKPSLLWSSFFSENLTIVNYSLVGKLVNLVSRNNCLVNVVNTTLVIWARIRLPQSKLSNDNLFVVFNYHGFTIWMEGCNIKTIIL